jgi:hypothetical protein
MGPNDLSNPKENSEVHPSVLFPSHCPLQSFISNLVVGPNTSKGRAEIDSFSRGVVESQLIPASFVGATNPQEEI